MRTVVVFVLATLFIGCAGLTYNSNKNRMWTSDGEGEPKLTSRLEFGPSPDALKKLEPAAVKEVLLAYADAASSWGWFDYALTLTQSIGAEISTEGKLDAKLRAMLAKEIKDIVEGTPTEEPTP